MSTHSPRTPRDRFELELDPDDRETGGIVLCESKHLMTNRTLQFMMGLLSVKQLNKLKRDGVLTVLLDPELFYQKLTTQNP